MVRDEGECDKAEGGSRCRRREHWADSETLVRVGQLGCEPSRCEGDLLSLQEDLRKLPALSILVPDTGFDLSTGWDLSTAAG